VSRVDQNSQPDPAEMASYPEQADDSARMAGVTRCSQPEPQAAPLLLVMRRWSRGDSLIIEDLLKRQSRACMGHGNLVASNIAPVHVDFETGTRQHPPVRSSTGPGTQIPWWSFFKRTAICCPHTLSSATSDGGVAQLSARLSASAQIRSASDGWGAA
jgi:hypothetical protein